MTIKPIPFACNFLMVSATTEIASTSKPESISSSIAIFGFKSNNCKISFLFFSPPENPSFNDLVARSNGIFNSLVALSKDL